MFSSFIRHCIWSWSCQQQDGAESGKHLGAPPMESPIVYYLSIFFSSLLKDDFSVHLLLSLFHFMFFRQRDWSQAGMNLFIFHLAGEIPIFLAVFLLFFPIMAPLFYLLASHWPFSCLGFSVHVSSPPPFYLDFSSFLSLAWLGVW